jgi:hypothetical protein
MKQDLGITIIARADNDVEIIVSDNIMEWEDYYEIGKRLAIQHAECQKFGSVEWESRLIILKEIVKAANRHTLQMKKERRIKKEKKRINAEKELI